MTVVQVGTNNVPDHTSSECFEEIRQTLDNVARKRKGNLVLFCQLPPRFDKKHLNSKIDEVNLSIANEVKKYENVHLLCHDGKRSDFNRGGLHFNKRGKAKFALQIRHVLRKMGNSE